MNRRLLTCFILMILYTTTFAQNGVMQQWERHFAEPDSGNFLYDMEVDGDGNIYLLGSRFQSDPATFADFATLKYNSSGELLWEVNFDSQWNGTDKPSDMIIDDNGYIYVTGWSDGSLDLEEYVTIKYNSSGVEQWHSIFNGPGLNGQSFNDHATHITLDNQGNVYVTGFLQIMDSTYIYTDIGTVKYNSNGEELWSAQFVNPNGDDEPKAITVDEVGNVYVIGYTNPIDFNLLDDIVFICYDSQGNEKWAKIIDDGIHGHGQGIDVVTDSEGYIYITGFINSLTTDSNADILTEKYDANGNLIWSNIVDTNIPDQGDHYDTPSMMKFDSNENLYITGSTGGTENVLIKYDKAGVEQWINLWNYSILTGYTSCLTIDKTGNIYLLGDGWTSEGEQLGTAKYSPQGEKLWEILYEDNMSDDQGVFNNWACGIGLDDSANVLVAATTSNSGSEIFTLIKYKQTGVTDIQNDETVPNKLNLDQNYPNPFNPTTTISYSIPSSVSSNGERNIKDTSPFGIQNDNSSSFPLVHLTVYDIMGREVATLVNYQQQPGNYEVTFDASKYSSGIYYYQLVVGINLITKKCILLK